MADRDVTPSPDDLAGTVREALDALADAAKGWPDDNWYERAEKAARPALDEMERVLAYIEEQAPPTPEEWHALLTRAQEAEREREKLDKAYTRELASLQRAEAALRVAREELVMLERWAGEQNAGNAFADQVRLWAVSKRAALRQEAELDDTPGHDQLSVGAEQTLAAYEARELLFASETASEMLRAMGGLMQNDARYDRKYRDLLPELIAVVEAVERSLPTNRVENLELPLRAALANLRKALGG